MKNFCAWFSGSAGKESPCNADLVSIPGLGRSPGDRNSHPLKYCGLENSMDFIVHGFAKSWTELSDFHFHPHKVSQEESLCFCFLEEIRGMV